GDRGYLAGGDLFFVAREKDLIVIGGEKIAPHDVEAVVNEVAGVRPGCAVAFGVANPARGTEDVAVVAETREEDAEERAGLESAIRARVVGALGLALRHVLLVPPGGVEKTTSGKLARRATRARYADCWRSETE
ncbi:MAG: acyl-phosphate glycerol 3-phosphate acyltransferase, partial [Candidatus Rokubacteria bacterium]|nr:acyl-phosphate glycerol 3-phosphate acyltransferase [Candidatus Rokubacteria bacterium]